MRFWITGLLGIACLTGTASAQFQYGHLFISDYSGLIYEVDPSTFSATVFADQTDGLNGTSALAFTTNHTLLASNYATNEVIEFDASGNGTVVLDASDGLNGPFGENGIALDQAGRVLVSNYTSSQILRFEADYTGGVVFADAADGIVQPDGLALLASGDLIVANRSSGGYVLSVAPDGTTTPFDQIPGEDCFSAAARANGDIYIACISGNVYRYVGGVAGGRVLLGNYSAGGSNPGIQFDPLSTVLYFVAYNDPNLQLIDPDTGSSTSVSLPGVGGLAIAVVGDCPPGGFTEYGTGLAGAGGIVPALHGTGHPTPGGTVTLQARDFVGDAFSMLMYGLAPGSTPGYGGTFYVSFGAPFFFVPIHLPGTPGAPGEGDFDLTATLPADPSLLCLHIYLQWFAEDTAAMWGFSISNALNELIGT